MEGPDDKEKTSRPQHSGPWSKKIAFTIWVLLTTILILLVLLLRVRIPSAKPTPVPSEGRCSRCPDLWITINDKCYFFSEDKKSQSLSDKDCAERDSRLALVKEETLRRLVTNTGKEFWVGITLYNFHGGVWRGKWTDDSMETVTGETGSCAKLGSRLTRENCYEGLNYICERDTVLPH
ncbi:killer cell lectin-like receptor subfamily B member 1A [Aquarana catesbeiana]|uniref:killer cell lectin-like receptor subfamily B member 1A n=1 Tax=Aquarana catesbeiana TaxID=8400 RepID=UPI003CCA600C